MYARNVVKKRGRSVSLDKAIASGKERRKAYTGAKAIACSCRNHGTCEWCKRGRLYQLNKEKERMKEREKEWEEAAIE